MLVVMHAELRMIVHQVLHHLALRKRRSSPGHVVIGQRAISQEDVSRRRFAVYGAAARLAQAIGLGEADVQGIKTAALLQDIGKLAVPEHIISKPGRLSPEEFEKMKIHTLVGAEILERVRFPYPVVPIVRAHHEKWDGSGYPLGLKGAEIPIGARILSAVDYLDALASDRQYRRALPLKDVMQKLAAESGKSFDPKVVEVLKRRYEHLEEMDVDVVHDHSMGGPLTARARRTPTVLTAHGPVSGELGECYRLLNRTWIGRVGVSVAGVPIICAVSAPSDLGVRLADRLGALERVEAGGGDRDAVGGSSRGSQVLPVEVAGAQRGQLLDAGRAARVP